MIQLISIAFLLALAFVTWKDWDRNEEIFVNIAVALFKIGACSMLFCMAVFLVALALGV